MMTGGESSSRCLSVEVGVPNLRSFVTSFPRLLLGVWFPVGGSFATALVERNGKLLLREVGFHAAQPVRSFSFKNAKI